MLTGASLGKSSSLGPALMECSPGGGSQFTVVIDWFRWPCLWGLKRGGRQRRARQGP